MKYSDKTKEELLKELQELHQENNSLKSTYSKCTTESQQEGEELKELIKNLQTTFNAINDIILLLSPEHDILEINQAGLTALNKTRSEVLGKKCFHLVHNTNSPIDGCPCAASLNEKDLVITEYTQDNKTYELTAYPILDEKNNIKALAHIVKDITERKQTELNIFQSKKDWEDIFDSITDAVTIHDNNYNIIRSNKAGKALLKLPELEKHLNLKCFSFYHGTEIPPAGCPSCNCLKSGLPGVFEVFEPNLNIFIEIRAIPRFDRNNQSVGLIHVVRDISERKQYEKELIEAKEHAEESDKLKSAFLANIGHEIRTPMNAIAGFTALLTEPDNSPEIQAFYIDTIQNGTNQLHSIINDIIDIASIHANIVNKNSISFDLTSALKSLHNQFRLRLSEKQISFEIKPDLADKEVNIITDKTKLIQIISNLISNAIKFTKQGKIELGYEMKEQDVEFYVSDTGIGIASEHHSKIFNTFYQVDNTLARQFEGTGLGLSICKAYVEHLGGEIWLTSNPGQGSIFYFTLPFNPVLTQAQTEVKAVPSVLSSPRTILIVEDDNNNFRLLERMLVGYNSQILHAVNGEEAIEIFTSQNSVDLVLMDIKMPVLDGFKAAIEIRKLNPDIVIIAQTAYCDDKMEALKSGCSDFISKPFTKDSLLGLIKKYF